MNTRLEEGEEDNVLVRVVFFCFSNYISIRMRFILLSIHNFKNLFMGGGFFVSRFWFSPSDSCVVKTQTEGLTPPGSTLPLRSRLVVNYTSPRRRWLPKPDD